MFKVLWAQDEGPVWGPGSNDGFDEDTYGQEVEIVTGGQGGGQGDEDDGE